MHHQLLVKRKFADLAASRPPHLQSSSNSLGAVLAYRVVRYVQPFQGVIFRQGATEQNSALLSSAVNEVFQKRTEKKKMELGRWLTRCTPRSRRVDTLHFPRPPCSHFSATAMYCLSRPCAVVCEQRSIHLRGRNAQSGFRISLPRVREFFFR